TSVALLAKQRQRYHEKQAEAIAGSYERLSKYMGAALRIGSTDLGVGDGKLSLEVAQRLKSDSQRIRQLHDEFVEFFDANQIYLPPEVDMKFSSLEYEVDKSIGKCIDALTTRGGSAMTVGAD